MLTLIYAYYRNRKMLAKQYEIWAAYPQQLLDQIEIIVVDDGSPEQAIDAPRPDLPLRIYRILENKPWNQDGARNLGASEAQDGWLFFGDMDHAVSAETLRQLLALDNPQACYKFNRRFIDDAYPLKPAINIFACTRKMFWQAGGYDERYSGAYGSDKPFMDRMLSQAEKVNHSAVIDVFMPHNVPDCRTEDLSRTGEANAKRLATANAESKGRAPLTLNFAWRRVL